MKRGICGSPTRFFSAHRRHVLRLCLLAAAVLADGRGARATSYSGSFPQIGSIWWGESTYAANPAQAEKFKLFLGPNFDTAAANTVRSMDPAGLQLTSINAMETTNGAPVVPDSYYLLDVNGNRIQNWPGNPGNFILNLTNPAVAQFLAQYAYQQMTQTGFIYDGVFFDNVATTISTMTQDCFGKPVQINDNYPQAPDPPGELDAKWSAGIYSMLSAFRQLAPEAYMSSHANQLPPDPRNLGVQNGDALLFDAVNVREGTLAFGNLYDTYQQWFVNGQPSVITAVQSSPPDQIAYGYGYTPLAAALPSTIAFGQNWYPNMRFGLGVALMNNGYSIYDLGDTSSPVTWWYDEYDFDLGTPVSDAMQIGSGPGANQTINPGFNGSLAPWFLGGTGGSARGTATVDAAGGMDGGPAAHISVTSSAPAAWCLDFQQGGLSLAAGQEYQVQFLARSGSPYTFQMSVQSGTSPYPYYGLNGMNVTVGTTWAPYSVSFVATTTANDGILEFFLGKQTGDLWLENVQVFAAPTRVYRRDFTNGLVLLNGTSNTQTIPLESGLQRFTGTQAPLYQYIVDDASAGFTSSGPWIVDTFDTGQRVATGPYYHAWQGTLHELDTAGGRAQWNLNLPQQTHFTIQVWLPAAPLASTWTRKAVYCVMSAGMVIATATLDQSQAAAGDQWFTLFTDLDLTTATAPYLTVQNGGSGPLVADAVYAYSSSALYNDGSAVSQVTLAPFDAILLQRQTQTQPQTIIFGALSDQALGTAPFPVSPTASSGLPVAVASNTLSVCTTAGYVVTLGGPGICSLTATQPGNSTYQAAAPVTQTFQVLSPVISASAQSINFAPIPTQATGANQFTISAMASSGLPVSFSAAPAPVCGVSGNAVFLTIPGTCAITATQAGNAAYGAAPPVTQSFTVAPNLILNNGFENGSLSPWRLLADEGEASASTDGSTAIGGHFSAIITVGQTPSSTWQVDFQSAPFSLIAGKEYQVDFWAMSDSTLPVNVVAQGGPPLWPYYGLATPVVLTNGSWSYYSMTFISSATASDATLEFWFGIQPSSIWIDNVQVFATGN